jgi:5-oxoprolinase (ATP-hydrolysing)
MSISILSTHRIVAPFGLNGGGDAALGKNTIRRADGHIENIAGSDQRELEAGDAAIIETPGGGGFGLPDL